MAALGAQRQAHHFAVLGQPGGVDDEIDLGAVFVALPVAHGIVDQVNPRATFGHFIGAHHFVEMDADFRRRVKHGQANDPGVLFQPAPMALVSKRFAAGDTHGGEDAPAANQSRLAGGKANFLDGQKALVVEYERMNHAGASISGTKEIL